MKKCYKVLLVCLAAFLCLNLSACCGNGEPCDLLIANDSAAVVYSISVHWEDQTMGVQDAGGRALLERGETLGLSLEGETERFTMTLTDKHGRTLGRASANYRGRPLWLTLEADGTVSVLEEAEKGG